MPTMKNLSYCAIVRKGLIMSSPHYMKGHETVIGVRYSDGLMTLLHGRPILPCLHKLIG